MTTSFGGDDSLYPFSRRKSSNPEEEIIDLYCKHEYAEWSKIIIPSGVIIRLDDDCDIVSFFEVRAVVLLFTFALRISEVGEERLNLMLYNSIDNANFGLYLCCCLCCCF